MAPSNIQQIANLLNNYTDPKTLYTFSLKIYTEINKPEEKKNKKKFISTLNAILKKKHSKLAIQSKQLYQKFKKMSVSAKVNFFINSILDLTQTDIDLLSSYLTIHSLQILEYLVVGIKQSEDMNDLFEYYISFQLDKKPINQKLQLKKKVGE